LSLLLHKFDFLKIKVFTTDQIDLDLRPTNLSLLLHKFDFRNRRLFTTPK
jgi:hypothetical protein